MNLFKTLSVLLLAIAAVQGAIQCKTGKEGIKLTSGSRNKLKNTYCAEGVTQCLRIASGSRQVYFCSPQTDLFDEGCTTKKILPITPTLGGRPVQGETCVCTGSLCDAGPPIQSPPKNSASTRGVNFILACTCVMIALIKVAA